MQAFKNVTSIIAPIAIANIDTDMIIPKQYLKTIKRSGLGQFLFAEMGSDFILKNPAYRHAEIIITEENFGCGSSREHAAWSLLDFGIKVIVAPSFADIFYSNAFKNGLLLITLPREVCQALCQIKTPVTVDLTAQEIAGIPFKIDAKRRQVLLEGLDEIAETLKYINQIKAFEEQYCEKTNFNSAR